jgi:putative endonuclease
MKNPWYIYMVQCGDGTLYTGITTDVKRRINEHNSGKGSKYCRSHGLPVTLLMSIEVGSKSLASKFEYRIKQLSREHKQQIIDAVIQAEHDKRLDAAYPLPFIEINKPEDYNKTISERKSYFKGLLLYLELKTIIDISKFY